MDIGSTVKKLRTEKRLTQEELADRLGVSVQTVSRWENGVNYPDVTMLPGLAEVFQVTADRLLGIEDGTKRRRLIRTTEVFELESSEEVERLLEEFRKEGFPRLISHHTEFKGCTVILTVEKEFGVDLKDMVF